MKKPAFPNLARLNRVVLEPGDVVVLECPGFLSADQTNRLTAQLKLIWPTHDVLVLGDDKKLRIGFVAPDVPSEPVGTTGSGNHREPLKPKKRRG